MPLSSESEVLEQARRLKNAGHYAEIAHLLMRYSEEPILHGLLECLGRIPEDFPRKPLLNLLRHPNSSIRVLAIKNLAKLKDLSLRLRLFRVAQEDTDSFVRREAVSALGRMRQPEVVPLLCQCLRDEDPKVVLQALRGLLYFRERSEVQQAIDALRQHPNELIQSALDSFGRPHALGSVGRLSHPHSPLYLRNLLINADVRKILPSIPDESIHLTFTSPPYYNARDYSIYQSYEGYLQFLTDVFREVHRITKEGRFFVLNTSPVLVPRMSRQHASKRYAIPFDIHPRLTEIGWEFIDDIIWLKPDPSAKNRNGGFFQHRKPLAYKPNCVTEYVMVYRKKTDKLIDWNIRQYPEAVVERSRVQDDYEKTNVWKIAPTTDKVHPAVFPLELAKRVIRLYSYEGDLIFDPFAGSGTVGVACLQLNRYFLLTEQESVYARRALEWILEQGLLIDAPPRMLDESAFSQIMESDNG
ncbi:MAG: DNA methyltransferase [Fimbriimonadales bacterium]